MKSTVVNSVVIDGVLLKYTIEYKKIKNIYFRVKDDDVILVTANKLATKSYIESLLNKNKNAIFKLITKANNRKESNNGLYYLGNKLIFTEYNGKPYIENDYIYAKSEEDANKYIYSLAYDVFYSRLVQVMSNFSDLPKFTLKIRKMKTKWGVCNKRSMTVTLNSDLITKDVHLIDYVIVHELSHFKYMDHSKNFWAYVELHYPYYKQARRELNY